MIKAIDLSYARGAVMLGVGVKKGGEPCKSIEIQVNEIFEENPNYKYVDLVYKKSRYMNTEEATLIVTTEKK